MGTVNNGVLDGVRRIAGRFRDITVDGGLPGAPLGFRLRGAAKSGPPASGTWRPGDVVTDRAGAAWTCTTGGTPGTWSGTLVAVAPSGDTSGVKDTAAVNAVAQAGGIASLVSGATYFVGNLLPDSYGGIYGNGATVQAATGTTGYVIALKTPASTKQIVIRDLIVNCSQVCGGIQLDNTGFTGTPSDPLHTLDNVFVLSANGDGFHFDNNAREIRVSKCKQYYASGYGFYLGTGAGAGGAACTDSHFTDCTSGPSGNHGFYLAAESGNNMLVSCKAFYSGYNEATTTWGTTQNGFEVLCSNNTLTACSAQQSALHGFDLNGCSYVTLAGCQADTNSAGTTGGAGVNTNGATYCSVIGTTGVNNAGISPGAQAYGYQVAGVQTGTVFYGNTVTGSSGPYNYVSGYGYQIISSSQADFSQAPYVKVPSLILAADSAQALSTGSTILTATDGSYAAVPVTATAACTGLIFQAPANAWSQVTVVNESAYTLTFAASGTSNVAAGASDSIAGGTMAAYVYDGTSSLWRRTSGSLTAQGPFTLPAGTATAAPLSFQSGTLETTAAAGAAEYDGTAFYLTATASSRQVNVAEQFQCLSSSYTGSNAGTAQKVFNATTSGAVTLAAGTTYEFEGLYNIATTGTTSHQLGILFGGTATLTGIAYQATATNGTSAATASASVTFASVATVTNVTAAVAAATNNTVFLKGIVRVNAAGTFIPQFQYSAAPGAAPVVAASSYFKLAPIGSGTVTSVGNWS